MICNNFYSGFCFKNECEIFKDYLEIGDFIKNFLENVKDKSTKSIENFFKKGSFKELDELLNFKWNKEDLEELIKKGIKKEVFKEFATVYYFKDKGHLL